MERSSPVFLAFSTLLLVAAWITPTSAAQSNGEYREIEVRDGGHLKGRITLTGSVPAPKAYNLVTFPDPVYCGRISTGEGWRLVQPFQVGDDGSFQGVVVMLEDITAGKRIEETTPKIEAVDCTFRPFISVVRDGGTVEVVNMDPVFHDIQAYETSRLGPRVLFNTPLPMNPRYTKESVAVSGRKDHLPGPPIVQKVDMHKGRRIFMMQCGFHAYMESWGLAVNHPYVAMTDDQGRFEITDIPPGQYKVTVWHPVIRAGEGEEYAVTIKPGEAATLDAAIEAPKGKLYANQLEENSRFGLGILGDLKIEPTVEKQTY